MNARLQPAAQITPAQWQACVDAHWLSDFDVAMAQWLNRHVSDAPAALLWLGALLARQSGQGHVCLSLTDLFANPALYGLDCAAATPARDCLSAYSVPDLLAMLADSPAVALAGISPRPLLVDNGALYWQRAWREECAVAQQLNARLSQRFQVDAAALDALIATLFIDAIGSEDQRAACRLAAERALTVITGGPGTGKTTTVVRVLAILQSLAAGDSTLRIALAAPTGKAAARLSASIIGQIAALPLAPELRASIPSEVSTVHRLLGVAASGTGQRFRHHAGKPLALDVLVVDEASMLDLSLMAALLAALPASARVILLGDKDQLASVEAGAVLADICALPASHVAQLRHSFRFDAERGIGKLADAVRRGLCTQAPTDSEYAPEVRRVDQLSQLATGYEAYWALVSAGASAIDILKGFDEFRILCALREGPQGVLAANEACERHFRSFSERANGSAWYVGRPVMITHNDYALRLMNGDIGICLMSPDSHDLRVAFADGDGIRWLLPSRLPRSESVYAMTVHKSQGSEFRRVAVVLPAQDSPVLTRELIYTALTRARDAVQLCIPNTVVWRHAVAAQAQRFSGLGQRLTVSRTVTHD